MAEFDYKEYARQMRTNAVKNENGIVLCSPELWEQIASIIERIPDLINRQKAEIANNAQFTMQNSQLELLREKCIEHQDFHKGEDGVFRGYIAIEDLDYIINEVAEK